MRCAGLNLAPSRHPPPGRERGWPRASGRPAIQHLGRLLAGACCFGAAAAAATPYADGHPRLLLGAEEVAALRDAWPRSALFQAAVRRAEARLAPHLEAQPAVPQPKDAGGGHSHERHKANGILLAEAGALFQWTGEAAYATLVRRLLLSYARLYPQLGLHPQRKEQAPGRLFWQSLNESVWLVYAIQGYDAAYDAIGAADRALIEGRLLRPMARFLSLESAATFDKIHNHGTWATAAVGMTGYVLDDPTYVRMALAGTRGDGAAGFLAQLRQLFSPDGYYMEGPYYQRYAIMPFVLFAKAIERNEPQRAIFSYRDGIIDKAIRTTVSLTYGGRFFPINDALREKGLDTTELDHAIAIAYGRTGDATLLSLVDETSELVLTPDALRLGLAKEAGEEQPFPFASRQYRDGPAGGRGALTVLRAGTGPQHSALVFKATSHGMGHGHFDRLHWLFYDNGAEVVADYGAARFLNVVQKAGGRYLPENTSWAKQSIAHNTLVVGGESQFRGDAGQADRTWPTHHFHAAAGGAQIVSAAEQSAYPGTALRRTMLLVEWPALPFPVVLDVVRADAAEPQRHDLPLYFKGQLIESTPPINAAPTLRPLGERNGYQHLWMLGEAALPAGDRLAFTWLRQGRFYTYTAVASAPAQATLTQVGATDPHFNLRGERGLLLRTEPVRNLVLAGVLEPHGEYSAAREFTLESQPRITALRRVSAAGKDAVTIATAAGEQLTVALSYDADPTVSHTLDTGAGTRRWQGFYDVSSKPPPAPPTATGGEMP